MVTLIMSHQSRRQGDADADATSWFPAGAALGVAGLATASTAITCTAVVLQQQGNNKSSSCCYLLALSTGLLYTGIAELGAAVWVMAEPRGRVAAAGRRLVYASLVQLTAAVGLLAAATLFW